MPDEVSQQTLEGTMDRALLLLRAISTNAGIRRAMAECGYDKAEQRIGWRLLCRASGMFKVELPVSQDEEARAAIAECDAADEPLFHRVHAALEHHYPEQDKFVFTDLNPGRGPESVLAIATFLDRLDALESSPKREATREDDQAAIALLAKRKIDPEQRQYLRALVETAQMADFPVEPEPANVTAEQREEALRELRAWYKDWSETAHAVIARRDHLILMGLAQRKRSVRNEPAKPNGAKSNEEGAPDASAVTATPEP